MGASQGWSQSGNPLFKAEISMHTPSNNEIRGMNRFAYQDLRATWRDKIAEALGATLPAKPAGATDEEWRAMVYASLDSIRPSKPIDKTAITVLRHSSGSLDWDNAYGGLKPMLDCLVMPSRRNPDGLGFIKDDNPKNMPAPPYVEQVKGRMGKGKTELFLFDSVVEASRPAVLTGDPVYRLEIPRETPSNNVIKGMHFKDYKALRKRWQYEVLITLGLRRPKVPVKIAGIVVNRYSAGQLDWDNAYGGLKPLLDCLVMPSQRNPSGLGLIVDDNPEHMPVPPYLQQFPSQAEAGKTEILIYQLEEAAA
jgi:hypothetical protein